MGSNTPNKIMTTFSIRFVNDAEALPPADAAYGRIEIGEFSERFVSDVSLWTRADYERQWRKAALLIQDSDRAAMITSLTAPSSANFIRWWVLYREGDGVILQEQILFFDELTARFDPEAPERFVKERETRSEDGQMISEWTTSREALRAFAVG